MAFKDMDDLRTQRNAALLASDFAMLDDSPYDPMRRLAISLYRQELRDLPEMVDQDDLENAELPDSIL